MPALSKSVSVEDARERLFTNLTVPSGLIAMWSDDVGEIPAGWLLCDGNNGTPDLIDRYPRVTDSGSGETTDPSSTTVQSNGHSHSLSKGPEVNSKFNDDRLDDTTSSTSSVTVDIYPSSMDYLFIQSDGTGQYEKGVTSPSNSILNGGGIEINNGGSQPNAVRRNLRANNYNG
jgi:hypothetical protein